MWTCATFNHATKKTRALLECSNLRVEKSKCNERVKYDFFLRRWSNVSGSHSPPFAIPCGSVLFFLVVTSASERDDGLTFDALCRLLTAPSGCASHAFAGGRSKRAVLFPTRRFRVSRAWLRRRIIVAAVPGAIPTTLAFIAFQQRSCKARGPRCTAPRWFSILAGREGVRQGATGEQGRGGGGGGDIAVLARWRM